MSPAVFHNSHQSVIVYLKVVRFASKNQLADQSSRYEGSHRPIDQRVIEGCWRCIQLVPLAKVIVRRIYLVS